MKEVILYVDGRSVVRDQAKTGSYTLILEYNGKYKRIESEKVPNDTIARSIITGIIKGLDTLKEPCNVKVYAKFPWGRSKITDAVNGNDIANSDLLVNLHKTIQAKQHKVEFFENLKLVQAVLEEKQ